MLTCKIQLAALATEKAATRILDRPFHLTLRANDSHRTQQQTKPTPIQGGHLEGAVPRGVQHKRISCPQLGTDTAVRPAAAPAMAAASYPAPPHRQAARHSGQPCPQPLGVPSAGRRSLPVLYHLLDGVCRSLDDLAGRDAVHHGLIQPPDDASYQRHGKSPAHSGGRVALELDSPAPLSRAKQPRCPAPRTRRSEALRLDETNVHLSAVFPIAARRGGAERRWHSGAARRLAEACDGGGASSGHWAVLCRGRCGGGVVTAACGGGGPP